MKLFRVFDKKTLEEITDDCAIASNGELYWIGYDASVNRDSFFLEWLGTRTIVIGDGDWKGYSQKGFIH